MGDKSKISSEHHRFSFWSVKIFEWSENLNRLKIHEVFRATESALSGQNSNSKQTSLSSMQVV
jgi:hypothetical protein